MTKVENNNYHLGQLFWPLSQTDVQRIMLGFLVEGHSPMGPISLRDFNNIIVEGKNSPVAMQYNHQAGIYM